MSERRILVCEDDPEIVALYKLILMSDGWEIIHTTTCEEGLACLKEIQPRIVIMDLKMPGMGGAECCMRIKSDENTKDIPVILISSEPQLKNIAKQVNAYGYLDKPFFVGSLKQLVNDIGLF